MGHMVVGLEQGIGWTRMIQSEVVDHWIHLTCELELMDYIPTQILRDIIIIIAIILTEGVRGGTFQMSSGNPGLLHLMWK